MSQTISSLLDMATSVPAVTLCGGQIFITGIAHPSICEQILAAATEDFQADKGVKVMTTFDELGRWAILAPLDIDPHPDALDLLSYVACPVMVAVGAEFPIDEAKAYEVVNLILDHPEIAWPSMIAGKVTPELDEILIAATIA